MRSITRILIPIACLAAFGAGCTHHKGPAPSATTPTPPAPAPAGRIVPAVVAGFEHGAGTWQAVAKGRSTAPSLSAATERAARGTKWLAARVSAPGGSPYACDVYVAAQRLDWSRFGDTLRADVKVTPACESAFARLYVVGPGGKETLGPEAKVAGPWVTLVWPAGSSLNDVIRLGVRWRIDGQWKGRLGLDNVRVGAAAGLSEAWSVAVGPYATREAAVNDMPRLQAAKVSSFPVYVDGWYLNVGTFSTETAARAESKRLNTGGIRTTLLLR